MISIMKSELQTSYQFPSILTLLQPTTSVLVSPSVDKQNQDKWTRINGKKRHERKDSRNEVTLSSKGI